MKMNSFSSLCLYIQKRDISQGTTTAGRPAASTDKREEINRGYRRSIERLNFCARLDQVGGTREREDAEVISVRSQKKKDIRSMDVPKIG